jgi:hypothetical protein
VRTRFSGVIGNGYDDYLAPVGLKFRMAQDPAANPFLRQDPSGARVYFTPREFRTISVFPAGLFSGSRVFYYWLSWQLTSILRA